MNEREKIYTDSKRKRQKIAESVLFNMLSLFLWAHIRLFTGCLTCRVHVFDPVRQFHIWEYMETVKHNFNRAQFYPENQAVVINSFVDNKSMGVYVNLLVLNSQYSHTHSISLQYFSIGALWHPGLKPHRINAVSCVKTISLSFLLFDLSIHITSIVKYAWRWLYIARMC